MPPLVDNTNDKEKRERFYHHILLMSAVRKKDAEQKWVQVAKFAVDTPGLKDIRNNPSCVICNLQLSTLSFAEEFTILLC